MSAPISIYRKAPETGPLRQGEIVSDLIQAYVALDTIGEEALDFLEKVHPFAVVVSQDCDLDWDWKARNCDDNPGKLMSGVLFCVAGPADGVVSEMGFGREQRNYIKTNREERYQFLQKANHKLDLLDQGMPELVVDFKRYFSLPADEVYARLEIEQLKRRCRLNGPYLQHLISRFFYYQYRIALPERHSSEPFIRQTKAGQTH